jgi:C1A family cysteine protease
MKTIIAIIPVFFYLALFGQPKPQKAPADPFYSISPAEMEEMKQNGIILPPEKPVFNAWSKYEVKGVKDFPLVYDMRETSWLTPVKGQSAGACWAYSTMGAVESRWLMLGLGEYNLSDNNLKWCHLYIPERSTWGNHWMSSAYFARRSGPYLEIEDPYPGGTTGPDDCPTNFEAVYYITDSRYPPSQNMDAIKQTVLETGLVWSLMYYNATYFNSSNDTYFYGGTHEVNHAGCVIGWNDTLQTAGGTGAWIVRNTYGQGWGEGGYYYISYNDSQFLKYNGFWPNVIENDTNTTLYQYDEIGGYWGVGFNSEIGYGLVKFEGIDQETRITKIGTFLVSAGCGVEIKIFDNFNGVVSGLLNSKDEVICDLPGYYTFDLDSALVIPAGEDFYVQIKYDANDPDQKWPIAIEDTIAGYSKPEIETGKFWIAANPEIWPDYWYQVGHNTAYHYDLCIKAYAENLFPPTLAISSPLPGEKFCDAEIQVTGNAEDINNDIAFVEVKLNDESWIAASGTANWTATLNLSPGKNTIHARATDQAGLLSEIQTIEVVYSIQTIPLATGWSYISAYLAPDNPEIITMMQNVAENMILMAGVNGLYAPPPFNINTLGEWNVFDGYKIKMITTDNLTFCGDPLIDNSVNFESGSWLVPSLTNQTAFINDIFVDPENDILYMLNLSSLSVYWPDGGIYTLTALEPGKGYLANFKNPVIIDFPDYSNWLIDDKTTEITLSDSPWNVTKTTEIHLFAIEKNALDDFQPGFIGAFNNDGLCVGHAEIKGNSENILLVVYGNDEFTLQEDGAKEGELINYKFFDNQSGTEQNLIARYDHSMPQNNGTFVANGTSKINELYKTTDVNAHLVADEMIRIFPIPAKNGVNILLPPDFGSCNVELMTVDGNLIKKWQLENSQSFIGLDKLSGGMFLLRFNTANNSVIKKILIE